MSEILSVSPIAAASMDEELASLGKARVKVLGLGGGGSNAINRMIELGLTGVEFIAANTDAQALEGSLASTKLQLGPRVTRGLGAGGDPKIGAAAAMESSREIARALSGADMVFLTAGMGGGTGTGAAPVAAEIAREVGAVTIAIVTMPFGFEMSRRSRNAMEGVRLLQPQTHTLITVPNDRLLQVVPRDVSLEVAFRLADDVLRQGVQGIAELVTRAGLVNVDFAHVRELMLRGGGALMAIGLGEGHKMARAAVRQALHHPLVGIDSLEQASGVLLHFTGGDDLTLFEISEAVEELRQTLSPDADIVFGATTEPAMTGRTQAILIVTGIGGRPVPTVTEVVEQEAPETTLHAAVSPAERDLDLPAFLRRRVMLGTSSGGAG
ncbi:MAG TPA: cell division protein FtsZ [Anaerolineales bacterium]|nr:cell division protein FtsZ [Anaerolineales bacterium]